MNLELARKTIVETFRQKFDDARFLYFIRNLVNHLDENKKQTWTLKKAAFEDYVNHFTRIGTYTDPTGEVVDVLVIHLRKNTTLARGRVTLRNFVADYLATGHGQGKAAVMAAFVSPTEDDWRFSFVKLDYTFEKTDLGFVAERIQLTPARRYSYLVGKYEHCHTAQKQFLKLLQTQEVNPTAAQLEAAFSVEKVTKEFYDQYKDMYEKARDALAAFLDTAPKIRVHFAERGIECDDFAKKLLGQIVFLYFLQKKGWFGVESGHRWGSGRKDFIRHLFTNRADYAHIPGQRKRPVNFFNDILEPLFYEAIAAPRTDEDHYYSRFDCKIPFLNGGLFEPLYGYNWVETEILLPDSLFANDEPTGEGDETGTGILDVFDRFNFTVNETEPLEKEIAVDPEMLGLVFENLLPENSRHSSGTYYTPRVIVLYMCQQALLHYLTAHAADVPQADLTIFLQLAERFTDFQAKETKKHADKRLPDTISTNAARLDKLLATIAVCDPAIGSGAFPVGMMLEICRARKALAAVEGMPPQTFYHLKRHAIQHSIFGVDFDPGAVEIAKLRLWLSMVVDEDNINEIQPLPNLDYKIMQGNSLLEEFDGEQLLDKKLLQLPATSNAEEIDEVKNHINAASQEFFRLHGEGKKGAAAKLAVEQEIKRLKKRLASLVHPVKATTDGQGELTQQNSWASLKRIQDLHSKFFNENSRTEKDKLRQELDRLEWNFMEATLREQGRQDALTELKHASATHRKPFFLWQLQFGEVFQQRGGFDIVIGNPPYIQLQNDKGALATKYQECGFETFARMGDIYALFYERGQQLLRDGGHLCYITSNKWMRAGYGEKLRTFLATKTQPKILIDFAGQKIFEAATVDTNILLFERRSDAPAGPTLACIATEKCRENMSVFVEQHSTKQFFKGSDSWVILSPIEKKIKEKIERIGIPLKNWDISINYGIKTGLNDAFIIDEAKRVEILANCKDAAECKRTEELIRPILRGRDVRRYSYEWASLYIIATFPALHIDIEQYPTVKKYLLSFGMERLEQTGKAHIVNGEKIVARKKTSNKWFETQDQIGYLDDFSKPKIVWGDISDVPKFALDAKGEFFCSNTIYFLTGTSLEFLFCYLNSPLSEHLFSKIGSSTGVGTTRWQFFTIEQLFVPRITHKERDEFVRLLSQLRLGRITEPDINRRIYALCELTESEIAFIESESIST
jgi:hypothetical protein